MSNASVMKPSLEELIALVQAQNARLDALEQIVRQLQAPTPMHEAARMSDDHLRDAGEEVMSLKRPVDITARRFVVSEYPMITHKPRGEFGINWAAYLALGEPKLISMFYNAMHMVVGLLPSEVAVEHVTYAINYKAGNKSIRPISARSFCKSLGIAHPVDVGHYPANLIPDVMVTRANGKSEVVNGMLVFSLQENMQVGQVEYEFKEFTGKQKRSGKPVASIRLRKRSDSNGFDYLIAFNDGAYRKLGQPEKVLYAYDDNKHIVEVHPAEAGKGYKVQLNGKPGCGSYYAMATDFIKTALIDEDVLDSEKYPVLDAPDGRLMFCLSEGEPCKKKRTSPLSGRVRDFNSRKDFIDRATKAILSCMVNGKDPGKRATARAMTPPTDHKTYRKNLDYWLVKHEWIYKRTIKMNRSAIQPNFPA